MDAVLIAIGAFLGGGAFKSVVDWLIKKYGKEDKPSEKNFGELFENVHSVYNIIGTIKRETNASRVSILKAENGGGIPTVNSTLTSSLMYETFDYPFSSIRSQWQNQVIDRNYINLLRTIFLEGSAIIKRDDMEDGDLKDLYLQDSVIYSEFHYVCTRKKSFIYISLHYKEKPVINYEHRNVVRVSLNQLEKIFKKEENLS